MQGVKDGGQPKIDTLYKDYDKGFDAASIADLNIVLQRIQSDFAPTLIDTPVMNPTHLLMLFSAVAYLLIGIPLGDLKAEEIPAASTHIQ